MILRIGRKLMCDEETKPKTFYEKSLFPAPTGLFRSKRLTLERTRSRHHEDFLRIRIFDLAPGRVSADVDQPSVGIEWIVDETGFPWDRFRHRKLRLI